MTLNSYIKKKKLLFVFTIIFLIALIVTSIIFYFIKKGESELVQDYAIKATYNLADNSNLYPMSKEEGIVNVPISKVTLENTKKKTVKYKLTVNTKDNNTLDLNKIYFYYNNEIYLLSNLNDGLIKGTLKPNETRVIEFKAWVGSDLIDINDLDKALNIKYQIIEE